MKIKNIGIISIALAIILGVGTLVSAPSVYAKTKNEHVEQMGVSERVFTPADEANLVILKGLYKQISDTAKLIRDKVKAAKIAGKDLSAFTADLKLAWKDATHKAASHGIMLTEVERNTLATMQTAIKTLEQQLKTQRKAKASKAILDAIKVQIKAAIETLTEYLKTIHADALTNYSARLVAQIADANTKLAFIQGLLTRLP